MTLILSSEAQSEDKLEKRQAWAAEELKLQEMLSKMMLTETVLVTWA